MIPATIINEALKPVLLNVDDIPRHRIDAALQSPLLTYDSQQAIAFDEQDMKAVGILGDDRIIRTPFPSFRFCINTAQGEIYGYCERQNGKLFSTALHRHNGIKGKIGVISRISSTADDPTLSFSYFSVPEQEALNDLFFDKEKKPGIGPDLAQELSSEEYLAMDKEAKKRRILGYFALPATRSNKASACRCDRLGVARRNGEIRRGRFTKYCCL